MGSSSATGKASGQAINDDVERHLKEVAAARTGQPLAAIESSRRKLAQNFMQNVVGGQLRQVYSIQESLTYDPETEAFIIDGSKQPLGQLFVERIEKTPELAEKLVATARDKIRQAQPLLGQLEKSVDDQGKNIDDIVRLSMAYGVQMAGAELDCLFDFVSYQKAMENHLKPGAAEKLDRKIFASATAASGLDIDLASEKNMLLHMACEFGRTSPSFGATTFSGFDWEWYRRNYIYKQMRGATLAVTEDMQKAELADYMGRHGIMEGDFEVVRDRLKYLNIEVEAKSNGRRDAAKALIKNTKPESKKIVQALTYFAGQAHSINEEMNAASNKALNLLKLAAEKRGITQTQLLEKLNPPTAGNSLDGIKDISHANLGWEGNPGRLLAAAQDLQSWVNKDTMVADLLSRLIVVGEVQDKLSAIEILEKAANAGLNTYTLMHAVGYAMEFSCGEEAAKRLREIVLKQNRRFGLPDEEVLDHWLKADLTDTRDRTLYLNVASLEELHRQRPGAAKILHDTYGISCFGRYNTQTLIRQYDSLNETPEILGVAIVCRSSEGALYDLSDIMERLSKDLNVKIIEGEQPEELERYLTNVKNRHKKRAQFAVVAMHAHILDELLDKTLPTYDTTANIFFEDHPTYVMISCLVSAPGKAKERLEAHGAKVIGPPHIIYRSPPTFQYRITPGKKVEFDVEYSTERF